jgi:hypothetical protein
VRAVSAHDVWAVGISQSGAASRTIVLHWNGHRWARLKSPSPGLNSYLFGVAATSASNAWAVGIFIKNNRDRTLVLHWNGHKWARVASPNPATLGEFLGSVAATSTHNAWAVGEFADSAGRDRTLVLHWNGRTWAKVASPNPGGARSGDELQSVAATASSSAWAVGSYFNGSDTIQNVVILHWNGSTWTAVTGPRPGTRNELFAVAASSSSNVWAVGDFSAGGADQNLAFHCC